MIKRCVALLLFFFVSGIPLFAQQARLEGRVIGSQERATGGAEISFARLSDGLVRHTVTNGIGEFSFDANPGEYELDVTVPGLATVRRIIRLQNGISRLIIDTRSRPPGNANLTATVIDSKVRQSLSALQTEFVLSLQKFLGPKADASGGIDAAVDGQRIEMFPPRDQVTEVWIGADPFTTEFSRPGFNRFDLISPAETQPIHASVGFIYAQNVLNHPNFTNVVGTQTSALFGRPLATSDPRRVELGARFIF